MAGAPFAWIILAALAADPDPSSLVARLGSVGPEDRAAAAGALKALGRAALPALRAAARDTPDPEARARASALWDDIQRDLMIRPTPVRLDFAGRPAPEVVAALADQAGIPLKLANINLPGVTVMLRRPTPVPFWEALDQLAEAAHLTFQLGVGGPAEGRGPYLQLQEGEDRPPVSYSGPFRVALRGLHLHRDRMLIPGPWLKVDSIRQRIPIPRTAAEATGETRQLFGDLLVMVEPRMLFEQAGPVRVVEAVDDLGQSLLPPGPAAGDPSLAYYPRPEASAVVRLPLGLPAQPGRTIRRLRGTVPVSLQVRKPDPARVLPLEGAAGKTITLADATVTIRQVQATDHWTRIALSAQLDLERAGRPGPKAITSRLSGLMGRQIEVVDAEGTAQFGAGGGNASPDNHASWDYTYSGPEPGPPVAIRFYDLVRASSEVDFEFSDVPLP